MCIVFVCVLSGELDLNPDVFDVTIRKDIVQRVVNWQRAKRRQGTHKTKTRAEVRGSNRKPWPQKGTGRARAGGSHPPHWRGGIESTMHTALSHFSLLGLEKHVQY